MSEKKPKKRKLNPPKSKTLKSSPKPIASELISRASPTKMVTSTTAATKDKKETLKPSEAATAVAAPVEPNLLKMVTTTNIPASSSHSAAAVRQMREELLKKVELLSSHLPANTLDQLIDELGGPECVAEVSCHFIMHYAKEFMHVNTTCTKPAGIITFVYLGFQQLSKKINAHTSL